MSTRTKFDVLINAGTAVIADVFDSFGKLPLVLDNSLFALQPEPLAFIGPAYTITGESIQWSGADRTKLAAIDAMPPSGVAVWARNDIKGVCCFGDLLGTAMLARDCSAIVVDGGVRDSSFLRSVELPIRARYLTPVQAVGRWRVTASQVPVRVKGAIEDWIMVNPGDMVAADSDGIIVIPLSMLSDVSSRVLEWSRTESQSREDIRNVMPLLVAIEKYGHL